MLPARERDAIATGRGQEAVHDRERAGAPDPARQGGARSRPLSGLAGGPLPAVLALAAVLFVISLIPGRPNDLYWHMRVGQMIRETGAIPSTNVFAWTVPPDTPYADGEWLSQVLLAQLDALGGLELLVFVRNLLAGVLLGLVAVEAHARTSSWRLAGVAVVGAGVLMLNNVLLRPQMFAWLPFGLTVLLLSRYVHGRLPASWLAALLAAIMVFWVNAHGSFVLGLLLVGGVLAGELLARWRGPAARAGNARLRGLWLALGAVVLASLANPHGPGIYGYVGHLLQDAPTQRLGAEWQSPAPNGLVGGWFYASVLLLLVAWGYRRERPPMRDIVVVCGLLWLAWHGARYVLWYGVVAIPILVEAFAKLRGVKRDSRPAAGRSPSWATALLASLLLVPVVLVQPWFGRVPALVEATPFAAVEYLRAQPGGVLFNERGYGSYLVWALPQVRVFIHPLTELYPLDLWEDYLAIGDGRDAVALLERYGADRALVSRTLQPKLSAALEQSTAWRREFADDEAEVWRRQPSSIPPRP